MIPRAGELTRLQATQDAHMADTCKILVRSASNDSYNLPYESYTAGEALACGFKPGSRNEVNEGGQVVTVDAELRLPIDTALSHLDRISLTHRHGSALATAQTFEVIGHPAQGPSGLIVMLRGIDG